MRRVRGHSRADLKVSKGTCSEQSTPSLESVHGESRRYEITGIDLADFLHKFLSGRLDS